jgi:FkbM family methyltransferase
MRFSALVDALPKSFRIVLADVGSAGGLHKRWRRVRAHVSCVLFDPLEKSPDTELDRYFPVALAKRPGRAVLHILRRPSMTSTLRPNRALLARFWDKLEHTVVEKTVEIETDSLDAVMALNDVALDVIKIDVQGGEYDILSGAGAQLGENVLLAEIETSFFDRYVGLKPFDSVVALMRERGFDLIDVGRIKRYRYRNSFGVINPGLGFGDRAGRLAFCDAVFLLNDEALIARAMANADVALKAIVVLLVYGKADLAAFVFDHAADGLDQPVKDAVAHYLKGLGGRHYGRKGLHRVLDYLARRV